jgi:hypothetical protein
LTASKPLEHNSSLPSSEGIAKAWSDLRWTSGRLVRTRSKTQPLAVAEAPHYAGLYRMTWLGVDSWRKVTTTLRVKASNKIGDPYICLSDLTPPIVLTIGRATDVRKRIRQHFGCNHRNNRMLTRLRQILPDLSSDETLSRAREDLVVEWVLVPCWRLRSLLEKYGAAVAAPVFDLDAEH